MKRPRRLVHLSDLHFGERHAPERADRLVGAVLGLEPDVVAVSGDLTHRARESEFEAAQAFLRRLPVAQVVVPGNHDIPFGALFTRLFRPRARFRHWITENPNPLYDAAGLAVLGIDTTVRLTILNGRVSKRDLAIVENAFERLPRDVCRVLVAHHPMLTPPERTKRPARHGPRALAALAAMGVDVLLCGHAHETYVGQGDDTRPDLEADILVVHAGTAMSPSGRGAEKQKNSFHLLEVADRDLTVTTFIHEDGSDRFSASIPRTFARRVPAAHGNRVGRP